MKNKQEVETTEANLKSILAGAKDYPKNYYLFLRIEGDITIFWYGPYESWQTSRCQWSVKCDAAPYVTLKELIPSMDILGRVPTSIARNYDCTFH